MDYKLSEIEQRFLSEARQKRRKIAIGIWRLEPEIVDSLWQASSYVDLTVVGSKIDGLNCLPTKDDEEASHVIIDLVKNKKVEGIVRGQLKDTFTQKAFLQAFNRQPSDKKVYVTIIAKNGQWFASTSNSNYNAITSEQKRYEIFRTIEWLENNLGIKPTIGITSTRRPTGRVGEFPLLEEIAKRCETVAQELREKGYDVKEYYIEYENAVWEGRILICPSIGIIGNPWGKALFYLGDWRLIQCAYLDQGIFYDDSPRNCKNWFWQLISTAAWINRGKL